LLLESIKIGSSVSVNGVCLTAIEVNRADFTAEATKETLIRSSLKKIKSGDRVNLERPLKADGRFDGHIVMGHVDTVGIIRSIKKGGGFRLFAVEVPGKYMKYIVDKGSIAVDGISLTVTECRNNSFTFNIIPHTFETTILKDKKAGSEVNIEVDVSGKYIEKMQIGIKKEITKEFLNENGYF
ncbi:MAG: riboflavin synthase, partial [Candidatus Firestonebacteria bacterium]